MSKTHIDWFGFRSKDTPDVMASVLSEVVPSHMEVVLAPRKTGWRSFEKSFEVWLVDTFGNPDTDCLLAGMAMTGGEGVKGWSMLCMTGDGCQWVDDWARATDVCTEQLAEFELKRVDVALDRYDGSHWQEVDDAWKAGEFSPAGSGRPPKAKPIDSRRAQDGRTYYVGNRESAKYYRGYEKGLQILGPQIAAAQAKDPESFDLLNYLLKDEIRVSLDGDSPKPVLFPLRDWWRDEVEFKPVNQPLPLDLLEQRDQYFAGAFPYLASVLPTAETQTLITRRERMPQLEVAKVCEGIKAQYGNTLFTVLHAFHGDINAVWDRICGVKHNRRLVEAGVLLVDHH